MWNCYVILAVSKYIGTMKTKKRLSDLAKQTVKAERLLAEAKQEYAERNAGRK
jgi:predicted transcriptional regulator